MAAGYLELMVVLLPVAPGSREASSWGTPPDVEWLDKRSFEKPLGVANKAAAPAATTTTPAHIPLASGLPTCFATLDGCNNATASCSGHGECRPKWKNEKKGTACYACTCLRTV